MNRDYDDLCTCLHVAGLHWKQSSRCMICNCDGFNEGARCVECGHAAHTYGCGKMIATDRQCDCFVAREDDPACQYERAAIVAYLRGTKFDLGTSVIDPELLTALKSAPVRLAFDALADAIERCAHLKGDK